MICPKCKCHNSEGAKECWFCKGVFKALLFLVVTLLGTSQAFCYTEPQAIRTIVGEASGEGFKGMVAIGEVIRHRATLKGCYGLHASHSDHESARVWKRAKMAWEASKTSNLTHGSTGWGNKADLAVFRHHAWFKRCVITAHIGAHWFYKKRRN